MILFIRTLILALRITLQGVSNPTYREVCRLMIIIACSLSALAQVVPTYLP
jgi:hypothetical protein